MSDLISRSALLEAMDKRYNEKQGIVPNNLAEGFMQMEKLIKEQPIAYDKEAVVEQLEERRKDYERSIQNASDDVSATYRKGVMRGYEYSKDVVKAGGIDERPKQSN